MGGAARPRISPVAAARVRGRDGVFIDIVERLDLFVLLVGRWRDRAGERVQRRDTGLSSRCPVRALGSGTGIEQESDQVPEGHLVDALALRGDEGRGTLR